MNILPTTKSRVFRSIAAAMVVMATFAGTLPLVPAAHAAATPTFVQTTYKLVTSGNTASIAFPSSNTAGDLIVAYLDWGNTGAVTLSDSNGNTYANPLPATQYDSAHESTQAFYAKNVAGGANTVTATFSTTIASNSYALLYIHEYSGIDKTSPLDGSAAANGTTTAVNTGSATTTGANDLIFGGIASATRVSVPGTGFTTRSTGANNMTEDKLAATAGSYNVTATQTGSAWGAQMLAFKADSGIADTTAPSVPTALGATATSSSQVNLSWTASTDNVGVIGYKVYRNGVQVGTATGTTYSDTGLTPSTIYSYTVSAYDAASNNSAQSSSASATTQAAPDTTAPSVPAGLGATAVSASQINLAWSAATDNVGVTGYKVYRNGTQVGTTSSTTYQDLGLTQNTSYSYTVAAYDAAGNTSAQSTSASATTQTAADTTAPTSPTGLAATAASSSQINLSWTASTDNVGVTGYKVYRGGTQVGTSTTASYQDTGLTASTSYSYTVAAYDAAGNNSAQSSSASAMTQAPTDLTAPTVPTGLTATAVSPTQVNLAWTASTDTVGVTVYKIYRGGTQVGTSTTASYQDTGLTASTTYSYTIAAYDAASNTSAPSSSVNATTPASQAPSTPTFVQINTSDPSGSVSSASAAYTSTQSTGNLNVVAIGWNNTTSTISSVTDTAGNTYTIAAPLTRGTNFSQAIYYAKNIAASSAGANHVTVTFNQSTLNTDLRIMEYSGVDQTSPLDVTASGTGTSTTPNSGNATTTNASDLLVGAGMTYGSYTGAGTGYTLRVITNPDADIAEDRTVTSTGSYNAAAPLDSSRWWVMQMVAFKAGSGAADTAAPTVPTGLAATATSSSQINLSWTAATDNVGVTGYKVYRNGTQVGTATGTAYSDTGLTASTAYTYTVSAYDAAGNNSTQSTSATGTTQSAGDTTAPTVPTGLTATATSSSQINLTWTSSTDNVGVTGYKIFRGGVQVGTSATATYSDTGLSPSTSYTYTVSAYDAAGNNTAQSSSASAMTQSSADVTAPSVPTNLAATAVSTTQINLSWTASSDNVGVTGYKVYRNGTQITTVTGASYSDTSLTASTTYSYMVSAYDAAGNNSANTSAVNATTQTASTGGPAWPLKASTNGRYLVDQNNAPFLMVGDSPQAMTINVSLTDAESFLNQRQSQGYNTMWIDAIAAHTSGGRSDASTYDGIVPFTTQGDLSTPNEAYFQRLDAIVQLAANHNMVVFLAPMPIENGDWLPALRSSGSTKDFNYGAYLGNRYKNSPNIVWLNGIDFQNWSSSPSDDALAQQVAAGIKSTDPTALQTVELNFLQSASLDDSSWSPYIGMDAAYTYTPNYAEVLQEYNRASMPVFMVESSYEGENDYTGPKTLRLQEYWSIFGGATGEFFGNDYTWPFKAGWQSNVNTTGAIQNGYISQLMAGKAWQNLVPDQSHTLVTSGYGTFRTYGTVNDNDYLTAERTTDGSLAMAYVPTARSFNVDMSKMSGPVTAQWFDPTNASYQAASGSPFSNTGSHTFTTPGNNSGGDSDWVLVLQTNPSLDTVAPSVPTGLATTSVGSSQVSLSWSASTDNYSVAGYKIYRDGTQIGTTTSTSYNDVTVAANTTYAYTVAAYDYTGNVSAQSAALNVNTANTVTSPPAFVQVSSSDPSGSINSLAAAYNDTQSAGNLNAVVIGWNNTTSTISSVTDTAGNTYAIAAPIARGTNFSQAIYYAKNIVASAAGANHVTVTFNQATLNPDLRILEYSGLDQTSPLDVTSSGTGSNASPDSGSVTTHYANELLLGGGMTYASYTGAGTGYTARIITSPDMDVAEDKIVTSTGSYNATAPQDAARWWVMQMVAFRGAGQ